MKQTIHALILLVLILAAAQTRAQTIYGLTTDNRMFSFPAGAHPVEITNLTDVTGLADGEQLIAIDMQPNTGELFGLAYDAAQNIAALYKINMNGPGYIAAAVNPSIPLQLGYAPNAGFDFNPINNNDIFITGSSGNVYILSAATGNILFSGGSIFYAEGDINSGQTPVISSIVHTNNFLGSDKTTQYGYDIGNNVLVKFDPNVNATIHTIGLSGLALDDKAAVGIDSYFDTSSFSDVIYMAVRSGANNTYHFVHIDPATGLADEIAALPPALQVRDIAAGVYIPIPATVTGQLIAGLTRNTRSLVFFDSQNPTVIRNVLHIAGVTPGQEIVAIDYRPFDLELYGLGYNNFNMQYQVYRIDVLTGAAIPVNLNPEVLDLGLGENVQASFDFNPFSDLIHVIGANGVSHHLSPSTGLVLNTDNSVMYTPTDVHYGTPVHIGTIAYTNSYFSADASQTMGIDLVNRSFISLTGKDHTTLNTTATMANVLDTGIYTNAYIDFYYAYTNRDNMGYLATNVNSYSQSYLYSLDPYMGYTSFLGVIGRNIPLADIAVELTYSGTTVASAGDLPLSIEGLYVYPNPANNDANVLLPAVASRRVSVTVLDYNGNILLSHVYKPGGNLVNIDLTGIPRGMYSLRVQEQGFPPESVKLVKQ